MAIQSKAELTNVDYTKSRIEIYKKELDIKKKEFKDKLKGYRTALKLAQNQLAKVEIQCETVQEQLKFHEKIYNPHKNATMKRKNQLKNISFTENDNEFVTQNSQAKLEKNISPRKKESALKKTQTETF